MKKFTFILKLAGVACLILFLSGFAHIDRIDDYVSYLQKSFTEHYDSAQESNQIRRYELNVTNNGFCRYKRYFINGKTEYFAFKLSKFKDMDYFGDTETGKLHLRTKGEDVIVQTYKDKAGDVDSMAAQVIIPLKNIQAEDLNLIRENLSKLSGRF